MKGQEIKTDGVSVLISIELWASHRDYLRLSFHICKMRVNILTLASRGLGGKESAGDAGVGGFDPWVGKDFLGRKW